MNLSKAESLGHLGLIAATIQDMEIMNTIDQQLGLVRGGVSYGQRVGAMVLNGLGFINTALYMTPRFFHDKPLSLLLGKDLKASQLNDDSLGRCLDKIAAYGTTKWYSELALVIVRKAGLLSNLLHLDSTTLSLYGNYELCDDNVSPKPLHGHSKDHRFDLKQVTLQCACLAKSALPIWSESLDGNSSDKKTFFETVKRIDSFYQQLDSAPKMSFIADSALYGPELDNINVDWLTRVPKTYKEAKLLVNQSNNLSWINSTDPRYQFHEYYPANKKERWLLIRSNPAFIRENENFLIRHQKTFLELEKSLWHCSCQKFNCEVDAKKAVDKIINAKKHYYQINYQIIKLPIYQAKGRPSKQQESNRFCYQVIIKTIASDLTTINDKRATLGRFILATNVLDKEKMSNEVMLSSYKEQGEIERGFRFIKNDTFGLDEVYLKKPERIGALMAIMTLCLLVYGLTQYRLRQALQENNEVLPNQKKKPTKTPTLMWIFCLFASITVVTVSEEEEEGGDGKAGGKNKERQIVLNIQPIHKKVILLLGETARKIYLLPEKIKIGDVELNQKNWLEWCGI